MAGAIAGAKEHYNRRWFTRQAIGTTLDAYTAFLLARGLKTFNLRAAAMAQGAAAVADFLVDQPAITNLRYPGLAQDPGHAVAARQMEHGFGGMLAFDVGESEED